MNYGMKVRIKHRHWKKYIILRNVTEIHYNYRELLRSIDMESIAFESSIHSAGCTYLIKDIMEFEAKSESKKAGKF